MSDSKILNVDGAVVAPEDEPRETYKPLPETDDLKPVTNSNMVKENGDNSPDGAHEKMLREDDKKVSPNADLADVKFITGDQQNGDAKIDILEIKQGFNGLTKEELLKYCNDPFWVRLRWAMFIFFWLLWLGMLIGAIVIIVFAPKCARSPEKKWWEEGPLVEVDVPRMEFYEDLTVSPIDEVSAPHMFSNLESALDSMTDFKFKGIIISEQIISGMDAYTSFLLKKSDEDAFKTLSEKAKQKGMRFIMDFTPNYVSKENDWFKKSERKETPFDDYFIWSNGTKNLNGDNEPPNNWITVNGNKSAWSYSTERKQYFLHQLDENRPDLNFRNQDVIEEFGKVLQYWIGNGAVGARLSNVKYMLVDPSLASDSIKPLSASDNVHTDYKFYDHHRTSNQPGIAGILAQWKDVVLKSSKEEGLLMLNDNLQKLDPYKINGTLAFDLPMSSKIFDVYNNIFTPKTYNNHLRSFFAELGNDSWPSWKYLSHDGSYTSELAIIASLLPGVPVLTFDQTQKEDSPTELSEEYKELLELRTFPSFLYGQSDYFSLNNDTVIGFTRLKPGNPGIMVVFNPTSDVLKLNITTVEGIPPEVTVSLLSYNYDIGDVKPKSKLPSSAVPLAANSAMVLTYVLQK